MSNFIWMNNAQDCVTISATFNLDPEAVKRLYQEDVFNNVRRAFNETSGLSVTVESHRFAHYPIEYLERQLLDALYSRPIEWSEVYGSVVEIDDPYPLVQFRLSAVIDDTLYTNSFRTTPEDLSPRHEGDNPYAEILNEMVYWIDRKVNADRYGPQS